jgi:hypothetical protein
MQARERQREQPGRVAMACSESVRDVGDDVVTTCRGPAAPDDQRPGQSFSGQGHRLRRNYWPTREKAKEALTCLHLSSGLG